MIGHADHVTMLKTGGAWWQGDILCKVDGIDVSVVSSAPCAPRKRACAFDPRLRAPPPRPWALTVTRGA